MKPEIKERVERIRKGEVPEGYKKTKVGIIPDDWAVKKLAEVADIKTGPFGSALHKKDYVKDGTPIITVEHLGEQGVVHDNLPMVSDFDRNRLKSYVLKIGDIVFSRVGSVDRNSLIRETENGWLFSGRLLRIRVTTANISPSYLSYHFHQEITKQRIRSVAVGQTMASLNTQILKDILVSFPPTRAEQTAIATVLSDTNALISQSEKLIEEKKEFKRGLMQNIISDQMNDDYSWKFTKFKDIFKIVKRPIDKHPEEEYKRLTVKRRLGGVQLRDIKKGKEILVDSQHIVKEGDFIISNRQVFHGAIGVVQKKLENSIVSMDYSILRCNEGFDTEFLFYCMYSPQFKKTIIKRTQGVHEEKFVFLFNEWYKTLGLHIPSIDEQKSTVSVLNNLNENIQILTNEVAQFKEQKRGLMQLLLTGIVRVEVN